MTKRDGERVGEAARYPGTIPARRRWLRSAALLAGASLVASLVQLRATPSYAAEGSGSRTADVSLDSLSPAVPAKGSTITVSGTVTNDGRTAITDAHIGVRVAPGGPLSSRSAISEAASLKGFDISDGSEISGLDSDIADIPAGISRTFTLKIPVKKLGLGADGVYQLGISVNGETSEVAYEHVLGIERSFVPWYADADAKSTKLTFLWPLIDRPHLAVRNDSDEDESPIFLDDDLAADLAPGGRLQQMVALGTGLPVTWVIDPDLLAAVEVMTGTYRVAREDGDLDNTTAGTGSADAEQWLNALKNATADQEVVALPFGDVDIASIAHHGKDVSGTLSHLKTAADLSFTTVETILGVRPTTDVAWPVDGAVDPSVIDVATSGGADKVIARSDSLRDTGSLGYTPSAARPVGTGTTAVVADATLSKAFQGDMTRAENSALAVQQFVAQTLMVTMQEPGKQRSLLVAPQRMPSGSQAQAMAQAIDTVAESGWAERVTFAATAEATPDPRANRTVPGGGAYSKALRKRELETTAFHEIQSTQGKLDRFLVILTKKDRATVPFGMAILRSMSTEWRGDADGAGDFRGAISTYLDDLNSAVYIVQKSKLTLSGRSAIIPVPVKNDLTQGVTDLELRIVPAQANRLQVDERQLVTIEGGHTRSLKFETTASANGLTSVTAQLYSKDGAPYGEPMTFQVDVTSITDTVMLVIAGGLLLLVLGGLGLYRRRQRKANAGGDEAEPEEGAEDISEVTSENGTDASDAQDGEGGAAPGQPSDPAPDTSPEVSGPSGTSEKVDR